MLNIQRYHGENAKKNKHLLMLTNELFTLQIK